VAHLRSRRQAEYVFWPDTAPEFFEAGEVALSNESSVETADAGAEGEVKLDALLGKRFGYAYLICAPAPSSGKH
jgi:hypothetical protein